MSITFLFLCYNYFGDNMTYKEFQILDNTFNDSVFLSKVNNIFVKLFTDIMLEELSDVQHFISNNVYNYAKNIIDNANKKNARQMYDELNVKDSTIINIEEIDNEYVITVLLLARYYNYLIDKVTNERISGDNNYRTEDTYYLTLVKNKNVKNEDVVKKCPGCGASLSVNTSGVCPYCKSIYDQRNHDWILTKIEKR